MKLHRRLHVLPLLAATAVLIGCSDSDSPTNPNPPGGPGSGTVSFNASGAYSGTFNVSGAAQFGPNQEFEIGNWAAGGRSPENELAIVAVQAHSSTHGDMFVLWAPGVTGTGQIEISEDCSSEDCAGAVLMTNVSSVAGQGADQMCSLTSGTVNVTSLSSERAQGTFSGTGVCVDSTISDVGEFTISNGTFNVPLVPQVEV